MKEARQIIRFFQFMLLILFTSVLLIGSVYVDELVPMKYDLRDVEGMNFVTPVKTQAVPGELWNAVGLCWAFSSLASFETSLVKQGIVTDPFSDASNLSAWYLGCYVGYNHPNYEFNPTLVGDPPIPIGYQLDETMSLGWGGSPLFTVDFLSTGRGLLLEKDAPLPIETMKTQGKLSPPREESPEYYMLRHAYVYERQDYPTNEAYRQAIKGAVIRHAAVSSPMYLCPADTAWQTGKGFWRDDHYTDYYCDDETLTDQLVHMVTIIGWDDQRMIQGAPGHGAWLIKDSFGTDYHDNGFFWISYHDTVFLKGFSYGVAFVADTGEGYERNRYQTSKGTLSEPVSGSTTYESDGFNREEADSFCCARFVADDDQFLKAVGLITVNRNEQIHIQVYARWDEANEEPSERIYSEIISIEEKGYHVVDLSQPVPLNHGEEFVLVFGFQHNPEATREPLVFVTHENLLPENGNTYWRTGDDTRKWQKYSEANENARFYLQAIVQSR